MSFKDGEHLSEPCLGLSKDCLSIVGYIFLVFWRMSFGIIKIEREAMANLR